MVCGLCPGGGWIRTCNGANKGLPEGKAVVIADSTITCPDCGTAKTETMPTDACQYFYECTPGCGTLPQFTAGSTFKICLPLAERVRVPQNAMRPQPNAWLRSTIRSSGSSIPTEMRISAGVIPSRNRSSSGMSE